MKHIEQKIVELADSILEEPLFIIRINYKSGNHVICCFHSFETEHGKWDWTNCNDLVVKIVLKGVENSVFSPMILGPDHVESVWQLQSYLKTSKAVDRDVLLHHLREANI